MAVFLVLAAIGGAENNRKKKRTDGRLEDEAVTMEAVLTCLNQFQLTLEDRLKAGYTWRSLQHQLKEHLLATFIHVNMDYGIGGAEAVIIAYDIGHGKAWRRK